MPLSINDPEAEALVRDLSLKQDQAELADQLNKLALDYASQPVLDQRSADEILGYDENGFPR